jgi:3-oxoadipate enol-lactonase
MGFVSANGLTLHTAQSDDRGGERLVFINSLGSDLRLWAPLLADSGFAPYRWLLYDKRGHGLSDCPPSPYTIRDHVDDLDGLLQALNIAQAVVLIGISVGGMIAMDFASRHPQRVKALVLLDTFPKIGTTEMWNERIRGLREQGMKHLAPAILSRWFAPSYPKEHPIDYAGYYNMLTRTPIEGYIGTCEAIRDADLTASATRITCPTLVGCGSEDQATPPDLVSRLTDTIPGARYVEIVGAGHLPPIEAPQATAQAIQAFLKEVL